MFWLVNPGLGKTPAFSPNWPGMYWPFCCAPSGSAPAKTAQRTMSGESLKLIAILAFLTNAKQLRNTRSFSRYPANTLFDPRRAPRRLVLAVVRIVGDTINGPTCCPHKLPPVEQFLFLV